VKSPRTLAMTMLDRLPPGAVRFVASRPAMKRALRPIVNRVAPREFAVVTVRGGEAAGVKLVIDPQVEKFYWSGQHEPHVQDVLARTLTSGMTYWDVGTHVGFFALLAGRRVGPSGSVVAFEPIPENRTRLAQNVELNGAANVSIVPSAVGREPGEATMYSRGGGSSLMWTLEAADGDPAGATEVIGVTTLDDAARRGIPNVVKIDAEGAELDVLRGGTKLIGMGTTSFIVEMMSPAILKQARNVLEHYDFILLGDNHWFATPPSS
jgi:FkbM family methyltransferase